MCVVKTNEFCSLGVLIYIKYINIFLVSMKIPFKLLDLPIKRSRKEELLQGRVCTNVRATQNFLGSFSWSNGKTTSRRRNETGTRILCIWIWILPERPLPLLLDKGYASRLWGRDSYLLLQIVNMNRVETSTFELDKCTLQTVEFAGTLLRIRRARKQCATCWPLIGHKNIFCAQSETNIRISNSTGLLLVESRGLSRQFLKPFSAVCSDPYGNFLGSEILCTG